MKEKGRERSVSLSRVAAKAAKEKKGEEEVSLGHPLLVFLAVDEEGKEKGGNVFLLRPHVARGTRSEGLKGEREREIPRIMVISKKRSLLHRGVLFIFSPGPGHSFRVWSRRPAECVLVLNVPIISLI